MTSAATLKYIPTQNKSAGVESPGSIALIAINRPESANAFNRDVIDQLISCCAEVKKSFSERKCRAVVFYGRGKHFSAGADLNWMIQAGQLSEQQNISDAQRLIDLMESIYRMPIPTIALVRGSAYGGAVGITACCDIAISNSEARFCLSEVRVGLIPAVILPYLNRKIALGQLQRLALSGRVFSGEEAYHFGLVQRLSLSNHTTPNQRTFQDDPLFLLLCDEINALLKSSPSAQSHFKTLQRYLEENSFKQSPETAEAIASIRVSSEAQEGLQAFLDKKVPSWSHDLSNHEELFLEFKIH